MKTKEDTHAWTVYTMSKSEFIEKLGLAADTDYISVYAFMGKVEIRTTKKGRGTP